MKRILRNAIIIAAIVLVLLFIGFILAAVFNVLLDVLYIFLIILAAIAITSTAYLIYSIMLLNQTIITVRDEMRPLIVSVNQTAEIVKGTAKSADQTATAISSTVQLTSEFALDPSIRATSAVVAGQQMIRVFFGRGRVRSRAERRRQEQLEALKASMEGGD
jgi:hypothetical protein